MIHILGISGSLRQRSYNTATLRAARDLLPDEMTLEIYVPHDLPLYNNDLEKQGFPEPVQMLHRKIKAADAILFATPEYNYSIPGVLKNAIDWASRPPHQSPLQDKPAAIMGVTPGGYGTVRAQRHLRDILLHEDMPMVTKTKVLITFAKRRFDADLHLTDEDSRGFIQDLLLELRALVRLYRQKIS